MVVQAPFLVAGDEAPSVVRRRARGTVRWAVELLKQDFFDKDPDELITVYLFANERSYRRNALRLFGDRPDTPYGYYSPSEKALVMNIATGGGTLVHEIVHPFMAANFEDCPAWFNEGLGSLYEQSAERAGQIVGLTNWRLAGLQRAIKDGDLPTFYTLTHTSESAFYNADPGTNYAQSRYLLMYLQEKGLLRKYYKTFTWNAERDPSGYRSLKKVLGVKDMAKFEREWKTWVLKLRFRG